MPNINKVVYGNTTLIDLTDSTLSSTDQLAQGITAYDRSGTKITGTASGGGTTVEALSVTQNGTYTAPTGVAYSPVTVNVSGGGGGSAEQKQVNFIDYDGTILHSYTAAEANALTGLPSNPSHSGLTAQGWNWTLAQIKAQLTAMPDSPVWVGQMYITDDGKTRIYIHLGEERKSPMLGVCPNGTVDVDWGDGTAHDTLTGTSLTTIQWTPTHNYANGGDYVIKLTVTGTMAIVGNSTSNSYCRLLHHASASDARNMYYINAINRVEIGSNVSIGGYAFYHCYNLTPPTIPDGVTSIGNYAFSHCYSLKSLTIPDGVSSIGSYTFQYCNSLTSPAIPDGVTSIGGYAFQYCYILTSLTIPDGVTSIGSYAFRYCYSLKSLTIPDGVTSIGAYTFNQCLRLASLTIPDGVTSIGGNVFNSCYGIAEYHLLPTAPPTLSNTNAFTNIPSDCVIYVPYRADHSILTAYKTAQNWSTYASYMQEEPQ